MVIITTNNNNNNDMNFKGDGISIILLYYNITIILPINVKPIV